MSSMITILRYGGFFYRVEAFFNFFVVCATRLSKGKIEIKPTENI